MDELLKRLLTPDDDGRAFTEAVLLRASGALHRRGQAAAGAAVPAWAWLERWARPWVIAALVTLAALATAPSLRRGVLTVPEPTTSADVLLATPAPDVVLAVTLGN
jgi:hypothetical protein